MTSGILVFHIIVAAIMIGIILIQRNEGGGLGMASNSMGGIMTTRGTANLLTRITGVLAATFFVTTIILALLFKGAHKPKSLLDVDDKAPVPTHETVTTTSTAPAVTPLVPPVHNDASINLNTLNKTADSHVIKTESIVNNAKATDGKSSVNKSKSSKDLASTKTVH